MKNTTMEAVNSRLLQKNQICKVEEFRKFSQNWEKKKKELERNMICKDIKAWDCNYIGLGFLEDKKEQMKEKK